MRIGMKDFEYYKMAMLFCILLLFFYQGFAQEPCKGILGNNTLISQLQNSKVVSTPLGAIKVGCNFNDTIKKELLCALKRKWRFSEIDSFIYTEFFIRDKGGAYNLDAQVKYKFKPNSYLEHLKFKDSLANIFKLGIYYENRRIFKISQELILNIGYLYITEAKDYLIEVLKTNDENYDSNYVKLVLARLGDKIYEKYFIDKFINNALKQNEDYIDFFLFDLNNLLFINTNEAIGSISNCIDTIQSRVVMSNGTPGYTTIDIIDFLKGIIKNEDFKILTKENRSHIISFENRTKLYIKSVKDWFISNKGKYLINPNYIPEISL